MSETKLCPFCSEEIKATAIKCKHCGSMLSDPPSPSGSLKGIDLVRQALGDRYEVLHELGRGGMATVYKAIQKNLNRPVALKVIHQNLVHDEEFVKRFHREAQVCASLQHPNIVTVYDEGEVSGVHFLAMEYLEGTDLRELLVSKGRLSPEETLRYMLPIAEALDYAHGRGLIHRDIKSSNIFICHAKTPSANTGDHTGGVTRTLDSELGKGSLRRGTSASHSTGTGHRSALRVVLMDFGIAHAAAGTQLTRAGAIIGTPEYMSPEQAEGQKVDHRTDLYSLGVVMYECLSGQVPFKGDSAASIIYRVIHEQVDHAGLHDIPPGLRALLSGLMSKKPSGRLASAGNTVEAIRQIQQGKDRQPTPAPEPQPSPRPDPPPPRPKKSTSAMALFWVVGIIGLIILVVWISNYQSQRQAAEQEQAAQEAIASEDHAWQKAHDAKTIASYEAYLEEYPVGRYASQAREGMRALEQEEEARLAAEREAEKEHQRKIREWESRYGTKVVEVTNPATGRTWMDRNLGASRAATRRTDGQAFGHLYQWGRASDGHQRRTSDTTSILSKNITPGHGKFILSNRDSKWDWLYTQNNNLWQGVNGVNNPCPPGFRLPTESEWVEESLSWISKDAVGAFSSPLKLPMAGNRITSSGSRVNEGFRGIYWSSSVTDSSPQYLLFGQYGGNLFQIRRSGRASGLAIRCIKD